MSLSNNYPTTRPSLNLDFANVGALDPRITFTRSSIATVTNSLGLLQTVQANVPRFDYDPVTLAPRGLLIEEQRTNLLTYSEQFDNAAWVKRGTTTATNTTAVTAPDGTSTADIIQNVGVSGIDDLYQQNITVALDAAISPSFYIYKITATGTLRLQSPVGNSRGVWLINLALLSSGWERITATHPAVTISTAFTGSGAANNGLLFAAQSGGPLSFYIWGAQLTQTAVFPSNTYQRIAAATDYATGAAFPPYLFFDGVDDSLLTNSVDFSATDKMTVWAGVTKSSDAAGGVLSELTANSTSVAGSFGILAPGSAAAANYVFRSGGSLFASVNSGITVSAPITNVLNMAGDILADRIFVRINGTLTNTGTGDQGTGNYANAPLYIGRRNNVSLPLNGNIYSLIILGAQSTAAQISSTESWVAAKTPLGSL